MQETPYYLFRTTTAKLCEHIQHIIESGDQVMWPVFIGAREWVIVCQKDRNRLPVPSTVAAGARAGVEAARQGLDA